MVVIYTAQAARFVTGHKRSWLTNRRSVVVFYHHHHHLNAGNANKSNSYEVVIPFFDHHSVGIIEELA
jgi:hypothetical protein